MNQFSSTVCYQLQIIPIRHVLNQNEIGTWSGKDTNGDTTETHLYICPQFRNFLILQLQLHFHQCETNVCFTPRPHKLNLLANTRVLLLFCS
jgi:hypothetical protein